MSDLSNSHIRNPHQFWFLAILRAFIPDLIVARADRRLVINASFCAQSPIGLWGDLAIYLTQREVLVEHFSDAPGFDDISICRLKLATVLRKHTSIRIKDRPHKYHPALVIVCYRKPSGLLRTPQLFEETSTKGIWRFGPLEFGPILLLVTSELPKAARYEWLRRCARIPSNGEDFIDSLELLFRTKTLTLQAKKQLMEDMMKIGDNDKTVDQARAINIIQALREEFAVTDAEREVHRRTKAELEATKAELAATKAELAATKAELAATKAELAATQKKLAETEAQLAQLGEEFRRFREEYLKRT